MSKLPSFFLARWMFIVLIDRQKQLLWVELVLCDWHMPSLNRLFSTLLIVALELRVKACEAAALVKWVKALVSLLTTLIMLSWQVLDLRIWCGLSTDLRWYPIGAQNVDPLFLENPIDNFVVSRTVVRRDHYRQLLFDRKAFLKF